MTSHPRALAATGLILLIASACVAPASDPTAPTRRDATRRTRPMGKGVPVMRSARTRTAPPPARPTTAPTPVAPGRTGDASPSAARTDTDATPTTIPTGVPTTAATPTTVLTDAPTADATPTTIPTGVPTADATPTTVPTGGPSVAATALPPAPPLEPVGRSITLDWVAPVDLDLYVTGPDARTIYFGSPQAPNGTLAADADCASPPPRRERIDLGSDAVGSFRIGVDASDTCAAPDGPIVYRVLADLDGERTEATGTLAVGAFVPDALVVTVPATTERDR